MNSAIAIAALVLVAGFTLLATAAAKQAPADNPAGTPPTEKRNRSNPPRARSKAILPADVGARARSWWTSEGSFESPATE